MIEKFKQNLFKKVRVETFLIFCNTLAMPILLYGAEKGDYH
jgi:hypothetical protein